jgi:hypothetical protein
MYVGWRRCCEFGFIPPSEGLSDATTFGYTLLCR